jgi:DNA-binding MarR family transcriptional regulator
MSDGTTLPADLVRAGCDLRVVLARIVRRLRQGRAAGDLTLSEISVLSRLDRNGPTTPGALADEERVRPQAMGTTLAALEQRHLVERRAHPDDGRCVVMSATTAGQRILVDRRGVNTQRMARALAEFSPAEQDQMVAAIPLLEQLAERL